MTNCIECNSTTSCTKCNPGPNSYVNAFVQPNTCIPSCPPGINIQTLLINIFFLILKKFVYYYILYIKGYFTYTNPYKYCLPCLV